MARLFGTDGVRGVVGQNMNTNLAFRLAYAAGEMLRANNHHGAVLIGRDTRESGEMLEKAVSEGLSTAGLDVWLAGVMTTPGVAFLTSELGEAAGVVISASHNPYHYNGIKFFSPSGYKLPDEEEDEITRIFYSLGDQPHIRSKKRGRILTMDKAADKYIDYLAAPFKKPLKGRKIALDCANGAAYQIAPRLLTHLGAELALIGAEPDGKNINANCGAMHLGRLQRLIKDSEAEVGLALDGDADRALLVDENANLVDGDHILAIMAAEMKKKRRLPGGKVVGTTMSNLGLSIYLREIGCELLRAKVGDRYVLEMMQQEGSLLGGEPSGHVIFLDRSTTGDGLLTGISLLGHWAKKKQPLSQLAAVMQHLPQIMINLPLQDTRSWQKDEEISALISEIESELGDDGRIVVRASGTEPLVRIMVEGTSREHITQLAQKLADSFTQRFGA